MAWFNKKQDIPSIVFFPGSLPLRAEDFAYLSELGLDVSKGDGPPGARWTLDLRHPLWGRAKLICLKSGLPPFPKDVIRFAQRLSEEEKQSIQNATNGLYLTLEATSGHILRDRKNLLRFGNAVCGTDGLGVIDLLAMAPWTPASLQDELAHDADLDVQDIYVLHCITEDAPADKEPKVVWAHTHGLQEIGLFDFDLIRPSDDALGTRTDFVRAMAFAVLEEKIKLDGEAVRLVRNAPAIQFVNAGRFSANAVGPGVDGYTHMLDDLHRKGHGVACDDQNSGWFRRIFGRKTFRPSRLASGDFPDGMLIDYSDAAGSLMEDRAQKTLRTFAEWKQEFAEFEPTCLVKLKFATIDGGSELPWFEMHAISDSRIEATCLNDPYGIQGLAKGDRGNHPVEQLSDWMMIFPFATLSPRTMPMARRLRARREELLEVMREFREVQRG